MIRNALAGKPLPIYGKGDNVRDWLYVGDHCAAIWRAIERGKDGRTYNIGGNNEVKNLDLVRQLCRLLSEETGTKLEHYLDLITYVTDRPGHDHRYAIDASRIAKECGWEPSESLDTGLRKTVRWYLDHQSWVDAVTSGEYQKWLSLNYDSRNRA
jgi:dTDP-glucose 4,6-dehydratase